MKKIVFIIYLLFYCINTYADPIDIPEKTILSKDDLYLKGNVKTINSASLSLEPKGLKSQDIMTIHFYENGLVKKIDSVIGTSGQEFFYDKTFTKLLKHEFFYNSNAQTKTNHLIGFVKEYTDNYPSNIIYSPPQAISLVAINKKINYQDHVETVETYSLNSPFELSFTSKIINSYNPQTHQLLKSIKIFPSMFKNGSFDQIEVNYNKVGRSLIISKYNTTQFHYKNNELIEERDSEIPDSTKLYSDYQYDKCGNWVSRKVSYHKQLTLENRVFTYYKNC